MRIIFLSLAALATTTSAWTKRLLQPHRGWEVFGQGNVSDVSSRDLDGLAWDMHSFGHMPIWTERHSKQVCPGFDKQPGLDLWGELRYNTRWGGVVHIPCKGDHHNLRKKYCCFDHAIVYKHEPDTC